MSVTFWLLLTCYNSMQSVVRELVIYKLSTDQMCLHRKTCNYKFDYRDQGWSPQNLMAAVVPFEPQPLHVLNNMKHSFSVCTYELLYSINKKLSFILYLCMKLFPLQCPGSLFLAPRSIFITFCMHWNSVFVLKTFQQTVWYNWRYNLKKWLLINKYRLTNHEIDPRNLSECSLGSWRTNKTSF